MPTWLVESYWPAAAGTPESAADRLRQLAPPDVRLIGVVHVPGDEMALWRLEAVDRDTAAAACEEAAITFERIVEIVDIRQSELATGS
jgi:hypothetical protein